MAMERDKKPTESKEPKSILKKAPQGLFQENPKLEALARLVSTYSLPMTPEPLAKPVTINGRATTNPVLIAVNNLLEQQPSLALEKSRSLAHPLDPSFKLSPLQYAYWTENFVVCNLILDKFKPRSQEMVKAFNELLELQDKASFALEVVVGKPGQTLEAKDLPARPLLIKEKEGEFLFWANRNGKWHLFPLSKEENALLAHLGSPEKQSEIYKALAQYHTLERFDLYEYSQYAHSFQKKYPNYLELATSVSQQQKEMASYAIEKIGGSQARLPAWVRQLWYSPGDFNLPKDPASREKAVVELVLNATQSSRSSSAELAFFGPQIGKTDLMAKRDPSIGGCYQVSSPQKSLETERSTMRALAEQCSQEMRKIQIKVNEAVEAEPAKDKQQAREAKKA